MENYEPPIYDSTTDSLKHIRRVAELLNQCTIELIKRANEHDRSKLEHPEKEAYDQLTPEFRKLQYGSPEYLEVINRPSIKAGLDHHRRNNPHHIEGHKNGVYDMNLFDVIEMLCDWKAATDRNPNGDFEFNLQYNIGQFNIPTAAASLLINTAKFLKFIPQ